MNNDNERPSELAMARASTDPRWPKHRGGHPLFAPENEADAAERIRGALAHHFPHNGFSNGGPGDILAEHADGSLWVISIHKPKD